MLRGPDPGESMASRTTSHRVATWISELGGPAPLLFAGLLEVGLRAGPVWPTFVAALTMAAMPYAATIWLARAGRVSDRFVKERSQRAPILAGTLAVFVLGAVVVMLMGAPIRLMLVIAVAIAALVMVMTITLVWKISVHATLAAFFAGLQVHLFGGWDCWRSSSWPRCSGHAWHFAPTPSPSCSRARFSGSGWCSHTSGSCRSTDDPETIVEGGAALHDRIRGPRRISPRRGGAGQSGWLR